MRLSPNWRHDTALIKCAEILTFGGGQQCAALFGIYNTMATLKCEIRRHQRRADGTYNVKLRITHKRQSRWLPTTIYATDADLTARGKIKAQRILDRCEDLLRVVRATLARLSPFALEDMDAEGLTEWLRRELGAEGWRLDFFAWGRECIAGMSEGARGNYARALSAFSRFLNTDTIDINAIRAADIRAFGDWLDAEPKQHGSGRAGGSAPTSKAKRAGGVSRSYVRSLARLHALARRRYNDPDAERQAIPRNPFDGYEAQSAAPAPEGQHSLGVAGIQALIDAEAREGLEWTHRQALALFLLSFCLMGVNIADLYEAQPVRGEWWIYRRKKIRRKGAAAELRVRVPREAARYLAVLKDGTGRRWLGLHLQSADAVRATQKENKRLRSWQRASGWEGDFTYYAARHSWGTIAHGVAGAELAAVDEALGHKGQNKMASIYIEKDWQMLNDINARVLALFSWPKGENAF